MNSDSSASRWPPKSPREALLSSPSGRSKVRRAYDRTSPSPSPYRSHAGLRRPQVSQAQPSVEGSHEDENDDEDEETLRLKLQAIEAKLKLKRLQQKQDKGEQAPSGNLSQKAKDRAKKENIPPTTQRSSEKASKQDIEVAGSPHKNATQPAEQRSPGRVLLGIDKGLKGRNVSLRRPRKEHHESQKDFWRGTSDFNPQSGNSARDKQGSAKPALGKSFSERIAESRKSDNLRLERETNRHAQRSKGFDLAREEIDASRQILEKTNEERKAQRAQGDILDRDGFSREQILKALKKDDAGVVRRGRNPKSESSGIGDSMSKVWMNPNAEPDFTRPSRPERVKDRSPSRPSSPKKDDAKENNGTQRPSESADHLFEPFSTLHLSKRLLTQDLLTRTFTSKSILRVMDLSANVKAPDFLLPESMEADYVVIGIIASKSSPLNHKDTAKTNSNAQMTSCNEATASSQNAKGKFMVLQLTDLKWTVDLYLFTTAYTRFYKLTPGTVIAILNPGIMPPPPGKADTGRFSLTLNSSDDTVLEIGTARDLGWCKATRKDGQPCKDWVDTRHTEYCEFHVDRVIEQVRKGRMEVNGMSAPFAPGGKKQGRTGFFGGGGGGKKGTGTSNRWGKNLSNEKRESGDGFLREGQRYDRTTSSKFFVAPPIPGRSAAELLDREDMLLNRGGSKEERVRKRLAERERENEIAKQLSNNGNGAGANYLRKRQRDDIRDHDLNDHSQSTTQDSSSKVDARSLGLLGNKAQEVHISPIKKPGLKRKEGVGSLSPRKKTRFVLDKGIREPGRESLPMTNNNDDDDDDDDDLDIG